MSKKAAVGTPWECPADRIPEQGIRVLVEYMTKEGKSLLCVAWMDRGCGWVLHDSMRLPDGWRVNFWMPIPQVPPF